METLVVLSSLFCMVMLALGMFRPKKALFGSARASRRRVGLIYGSALFVCMILVGTFDSPTSEGDQPAGASAEAETTVDGPDEVEPPAEESLTGEQRLVRMAERAVGKTVNWEGKPGKIQRVTDAEWNDYAEVWIRLDQSLTTGTTHRRAITDFQKIFKAFHRDPELASFGRLAVLGVIPMEDRFGKTTEIKWISAQLSRRPTMMKVDWDGINPTQFEEILRRDGNLWLAQGFE